MAEYNFKQQRIHLNGIHLNVVCEGPEDAPLVILLHGFPEYWLTWKDQIQPLLDAGYRVMAPDQRGYNLSDKPQNLDDYRIDILARDIEALRLYAKAETMHLVGHDWGAAVAWWYALHYPEYIDSLTVINVPHPVVFKKTLYTNPKQMLKSWYMFLFQLPKLPEFIFASNDFAKIKNDLKKSSNPDSFDAKTLSLLESAWQQPGAIRGMINWYRAALRRQIEPENEKVNCPVRILWGENDIALTKEMAKASVAYCESAELTYYPDGTHWLVHDHPERVSKELLDFIGLHEERLIRDAQT